MRMKAIQLAVLFSALLALNACASRQALHVIGPDTEVGTDPARQEHPAIEPTVSSGDGFAEPAPPVAAYDLPPELQFHPGLPEGSYPPPPPLVPTDYDEETFWHLAYEQQTGISYALWRAANDALKGDIVGLSSSTIAEDGAHLWGNHAGIDEATRRLKAAGVAVAGTKLSDAPRELSVPQVEPTSAGSR